MKETKLFVKLVFLIIILAVVLFGLVFYEMQSLNKAKVSSGDFKNQNALKVASPSAEVTGPGGCVGIDQCLKYCQTHPQECAKK